MLHVLGLTFLISLELILWSLNGQKQGYYHHRKESSQALVQKTATTFFSRYHFTDNFHDCLGCSPCMTVNFLPRSGPKGILWKSSTNKFMMMWEVLTDSKNLKFPLQLSDCFEAQFACSQATTTDLSRLDELNIIDLAHTSASKPDKSGQKSSRSPTDPRQIIKYRSRGRLLQQLSVTKALRNKSGLKNLRTLQYCTSGQYCGPNQFCDGDYCAYCGDGCESCSYYGYCDYCYSGYVHQGSYCTPGCTGNEYWTGSSFLACDSKCTSCTSVSVCTTCPSGRTLSSGQCILTCSTDT